jgi:DNA repair protein RadA/Sms
VQGTTVSVTPAAAAAAERFKQGLSTIQAEVSRNKRMSEDEWADVIQGATAMRKHEQELREALADIPDAKPDTSPWDRWPITSLKEIGKREYPKLHNLPVLGESGYFVKGESHILAAFPKTGKTVLAVNTILPWLRDDPKMICVYFSEESPRMWAARLARDVRYQSGSDRLFVIAAKGMGPDNMWKVLRHYYPDGTLAHNGVVVIDTLRLLKVVDENDSAQMDRAVEPWEAYRQEHDLTLWINHHTRKGGGKYGEGVSGGHGLIGAVDTVLELHRDERVENRRILKVVGSRSLDEVQGVFERNEIVDETWPTGIHELRFVGAKVEVTHQGDVEAIKMVLEVDAWRTTAEVWSALDAPKPRKSTTQRILVQLAEQGEIHRKPPITENASGMKVRWRLKGE